MSDNPNSIYDHVVANELEAWKSSMRKKPSFWNRTTKNVQKKVNSIIPEKVHVAITKAIKEITRSE